MFFYILSGGRIAYRHGTLLLSPPCGGRRRPQASTRQAALIPYLTNKTAEPLSTIRNEGKSDLYLVAREGWKDR
jgi:hypothetical protein